MSVDEYSPVLTNYLIYWIKLTPFKAFTGRNRPCLVLQNVRFSVR